jgi:hypothetical protein
MILVVRRTARHAERLGPVLLPADEEQRKRNLTPRAAPLWRERRQRLEHRVGDGLRDQVSMADRGGPLGIEQAAGRRTDPQRPIASVILRNLRRGQALDRIGCQGDG